jgi:hypothetical protein
VREEETLPHLIADGNLQRCSVCGYPFSGDVRPSMCVAFAEHLMEGSARSDPQGLGPSLSAAAYKSDDISAWLFNWSKSQVLLVSQNKSHSRII